MADSFLAPPPGFESDEEDEFEKQRQLEARARAWIAQNNRRYGQRTGTKAAGDILTDATRQAPPEVLRKLMKAHNYAALSSDPQLKELRRQYIGQLRLLPHACMKLLENMPMPWDAAKFVDVRYHATGAITVIEDTPHVPEPLFVAQWAQTWEEMRRHKAEVQESQPAAVAAAASGGATGKAAHQQRASYTYDKEQPPVDFADQLMDLDPPAPVRGSIAADGDPTATAMADWFYDWQSYDPAAAAAAEEEFAGLLSVGGAADDDGALGALRDGADDAAAAAAMKRDQMFSTSKSKWSLAPGALAALQRLGLPLTSAAAASAPLEGHENDATLDDMATPENVGPNYYYLWNADDFYNAKALGVSLPGGPRFRAHPMGGQDKTTTADEAFEELDDITEFNDPAKRINRGKMLKEVQLAFPSLYGTGPRVDMTKVTPYHYQTEVCAPRLDDSNPHVAPFYFNAAFGLIRAVPGAPQIPVDDLLDGVADPLAPLEMPPLFQPIYTDDLSGEEVHSADAEGADAEADDAATAEEKAEADRLELKSLLSLLHSGTGSFGTLHGVFSRAQDVPLVQTWSEEHCPRGVEREVSDCYARLLRRNVLRRFKVDRERRVHRRKEDEEWDDVADLDDAGVAGNSGGKPPSNSIWQQSRDSKFFQKTRIEWLEAAVQLVAQAHNMIHLLLLFRNLHQFLGVTYNFEIAPKKILSTKERKRTRLGPTILFTCELMRLLKNVVDLHVRFRKSEITAFELAANLTQVFANVDSLTGMYRYKMRVQKQSKEARDLLTLIESRFSRGGVPSGPGTGFWQPMWRVYVLLLRGTAPLLSRNFENLLTRLFKGRSSKSAAKRVTKQRIETDIDLNSTRTFVEELRQLLPDGLSPHAAKSLQRKMLSALSEAFRCWKKNVPFVPPPGMRPELERLVAKFVHQKAEMYVRATERNRVQIARGKILDKGVTSKNLGRMCRLKVMDEQNRQRRYTAEGPSLTVGESQQIYRMFAEWLRDRNWTKIEFPKAGNINEREIYLGILQRMRLQSNIHRRLSQSEKEEQRKLEEAFTKPQEALNRCVEELQRMRTFQPVQLEYTDVYTSLYPVYTVPATDKIRDTFVDAYLWMHANARGLFPNWVKPTDLDPAPLLAYKVCDGINNLPDVWDVSNDESIVVLQAQLEDVYERVDWHLMSACLKLLMDEPLAEYMCARHNVEVKFKDMKHVHSVGILRGLAFGGFLMQVWGLLCDLMLMGRSRAATIAGPPTRPNAFMHFASTSDALAHPIAGYVRYLDRVTIVTRLTSAAATALLAEFTKADPDSRDVASFKNKRCWARDERMRLTHRDVALGRAVMWQMQNRLPRGICTMSWDTAFASVYSRDNPNLLLDMCGFELRILPLSRADGELPDSESSWSLRKRDTREVTARAYVQVTQEHVSVIKNKVRNTLVTLGNATYEKIAQRWNTLLTDVVPYYREAILGTRGLQSVLIEAEAKFQNRIKAGLNSKKPERFPPCVFYAPTALGGLGMLSIGSAMVPVSDRIGGGRTLAAAAGQTDGFMQGLTTGGADSRDVQLPNVLRCFVSWEREFADSARAWDELRRRRDAAKQQQRRLIPSDVADIRDMGVPRVQVAFAANRAHFKYDCGWRLRREMNLFATGRRPTGWWFSRERDGHLDARLDEYRTLMLQVLGGAERVLEHTLFRATGIPHWDALTFDTGGAFEDAKKMNKITKQQRTGLTKMPNERFALWWSATIARSAVYGGHPKKIELTGIELTGKLTQIENALRGVFKGNLWEKVQCEIAETLTATLNDPARREAIAASDVQRQQVPPRKSYTYESSQADIVLRAAGRGWKVSPETGLHVADNERSFTRPERQSSLYIDVQLYWGNYDTQDVERLARERFFKYRSQKLYPCPCGVFVLIDAAYGTYSAFGNWVPGLKVLLGDALRRIMKGSPAVNMLRTRVKIGLQIRTHDTTAAALNRDNLEELFGDERVWIVDDSQVFATHAQTTGAGNHQYAAMNGAYFIVAPRTGMLILGIVHGSTFRGQSRRTQLAREKAGELTKACLVVQDEAARPHKIITSQPSFLSTLTASLVDFPNIALTKSELSLPISTLLRHQRLRELVVTAPESKVQMWTTLYDDWTTMGLGPMECFSRLNLILRAFHVDARRTLEILTSDNAVTQPHHFWPTHDQAGWDRVVRMLRDVVLADYARRNNIRDTDLTRDEKLDVLWGKRLSARDVQREEQRDTAARQKVEVQEGVTTTRITREGVEVQVTSKKVYAQAPTGAAQRTEMAKASVALRQAIKRMPCQFDPQGREPPRSGAVHRTLVITHPLLRQALRAADATVSIVAFMYGRQLTAAEAHAAHLRVPSGAESAASGTNIWMIEALVLPPQRGEGNPTGKVAFPLKVPDMQAHFRFDASETPEDGTSTFATADARKAQLQLVGVLRTQGGGLDPIIATTDVVKMTELVRANPQYDPALASTRARAARTQEAALLVGGQTKAAAQVVAGGESAPAGVHQPVMALSLLIAGIAADEVTLHGCTMTRDALQWGTERGNAVLDAQEAAARELLEPCHIAVLERPAPNAAFDALRANRSKQRLLAAVTPVEPYTGAIFTPKGGLWNHHFLGTQALPDTYETEGGVPAEFQAALHRVGHFVQFSNRDARDAFDDVTEYE